MDGWGGLGGGAVDKCQGKGIGRHQNSLVQYFTVLFLNEVFSGSFVLS